MKKIILVALASISALASDTDYYRLVGQYELTHGKRNCPSEISIAATSDDSLVVQDETDPRSAVMNSFKDINAGKQTSNMDFGVFRQRKTVFDDGVLATYARDCGGIFFPTSCEEWGEPLGQITIENSSTIELVSYYVPEDGRLEDLPLICHYRRR